LKKKKLKDKKKFEKELKGKILPYKTLEELLKDYRYIYQDIKNRFPDINIEFVKDNYNTSLTSLKLYNINVKKLNYNKYIAYKLLKILITYTCKIKGGALLAWHKLEHKLDLSKEKLDEKLITKLYAIYYENYNNYLYDDRPSSIIQYHENLIDNLLGLERMILDFNKFVKDIDDETFMDNVNFKWEIMKYIKEKSLKTKFNPKTSPKSSSPKTSPKTSPKSSSPKMSPKTSPKSSSPKMSPKTSSQ